MDRALVGVTVTKVSMLRLVALVALVALTTGCLSGTHAHTSWRKAAAGSWPELRHGTQGLAIAIHSKWGEVAQLWGDSLPHTYVMRSDTRGPYGMLDADGKPIALGGVQAAVVELSFTSGIDRGMVLKPSGVRIVSSANPIRALDDAAARWKKFLADQQPALDRALDAADLASPGRAFGAETIANADSFTPTWIPDDERFVIVFARTVSRGSQLVERQKTTPCGKYYLHNTVPAFPEGRPVQISCPQQPDFVERVHVRRYSADLALVLEYDADGSLSFERGYAPEPMPAKGPY
jgi:hypothetical protein